VQKGALVEARSIIGGAMTANGVPAPNLPFLSPYSSIFMAIKRTELLIDNTNHHDNPTVTLALNFRPRPGRLSH
jgi:hypothetical protein